MNLKVNSKSVMPKSKQARMSAVSPRQYAGANGSMGMSSKQIANYHNTKGQVKRKITTSAKPILTAKSGVASATRSLKLPFKK